MKPFPLILYSGAIAVAVLTLATQDDFARADRNGDGGVTMAEAAWSLRGTTAEGFTAADTDRSGELSKAEFLAGIERGLLPAR